MTPDWSFRNKRVLIVGPSASGKTTYAIAAMRFRGPLFAFDQKGEFAARLPGPASTSPRECLASLRAGRPVLFNPHRAFEGRTEEAFAWFSQWSFAMAKELSAEKLFVVDELHHFTGTGAGQLPQGIRLILETGRCYRMHSIAISHGANLVNGRLRNQFTHVVAFRTADRNAIDFLGDCGLEEFTVTGLAPMHFALRDLEGRTEQRGRIIWRGSRPSVHVLACSPPAFPGKAKTPVPSGSAG